MEKDRIGQEVDSWISEDELADLYTDGENLKNLEKQIYQQFEKQFGEYIPYSM